MFATKYGIPFYPTRESARRASAVAMLIALVVCLAAIVSILGGCGAAVRVDYTFPATIGFTIDARTAGVPAPATQPAGSHP